MIVHRRRAAVNLALQFTGRAEMVAADDIPLRSHR